MHVLVLFNRVSIHDSAGDLDVLKQCTAIEDSLRRLGHTTTRVPCTLDFGSVMKSLKTDPPDVVFNLVESLAGTDRLMPLIPVLLESHQIPFTGAGSLAMLSTTHKTIAKRRLHELELPTPRWFESDLRQWSGNARGSSPPERIILKAVAEHASLGITDSSVIPGAGISMDQLDEQIAIRSTTLGTSHFAEEFIDGREFNLSVLASENGPVVLPPAEIEFRNYSEDKPRIVGLAAKWAEGSREYQDTPRRFDFPHSDQPLLDELEALARRCWGEFGLRGYARVDFRVDADGQPWILEMNANPCLSPDAGFAAAVREADLSFDEVVQRIVDDAFRA